MIPRESPAHALVLMFRRDIVETDQVLPLGRLSVQVIGPHIPTDLHCEALAVFKRQT